ncbi:hypothetical protein [Niallia circulans]|uniref:hypothetical protein n=1 Tax=Niallia circulans TaxID=1397 RepID=UPI0026F349A4|nr:hypothetical protein [Niallia circulans]
MKELLYYPNFFIEDETWAKFALLYLDKVITIIPTQANINYSYTHKLLLNETDLLNSHSPSVDEINYASESMGNEIGLLLNNPINKFRESDATWNFEVWKDRDSFTYELYNGKFPDELRRMLIGYNLAEESDNGIIVHQNIASIYMTLLAHIIGEKRRIPVITDKSNSVRFTDINRRINRIVTDSRRFKTLTDSINITLPRRLREISLEEIIEFRNNPIIKRNLLEFQSAVDRLNLLANDNLSENEMIDIKKAIFDAKRQYALNITGQFGVGVSSAIGFYQLINGDAQHLDFLKEVLGLGALQGIRNVYFNINEFETYRRASNYISDVENLAKNRRQLEQRYY